MNTSLKKGFTLIELLIVIGILAVLATLTILVLNPAQLFAQARDSQRISDLRTVMSAIQYAVSAPTGNIPTFGTTSQSSATGATACALGAGVTCTVVTATTVAGSGWVGIDLTGATGGSPLAKLPVDPKGTDTTYFYGYMGDNTNKTFELDARLESTKYRGLMATDGGDANACTTYVEMGASHALSCFYEVGTDPGLDL
jgi:prepilin-type N-terminal cleavage/methylation domain-containing protein